MHTETERGSGLIAENVPCPTVLGVFMQSPEVSNDILYEMVSINIQGRQHYECVFLIPNLSVSTG
jgi:hypothetical protein